MRHNVLFAAAACGTVAGALGLFAGALDAGSPESLALYRTALWLTLAGTVAFGFPALTAGWPDLRDRLSALFGR